SDERFIPATDILDVYREGHTVRVEVRGSPSRREYFQFWTDNAVTAGTIVRLLPTTRTIEYEGMPVRLSPETRIAASAQSAMPARTGKVVLLATGAFLFTTAITIQLPLRASHSVPRPASTLSNTSSVPTRNSSAGVSPTELAAALADLRQFDERIDA